MTFTDSIKTCINKYATFSGRAPRSEFWWFALFNAIVSICAQAAFFGIGLGLGGVKGAALATNICSVLVLLLFFVPSLAVAVRRLHDTGHSGWWVMLVYGPTLLLVVLMVLVMLTRNETLAFLLLVNYVLLLIGSLWLLVLFLLDSDEENKYGLPVY